MSLVAAGSYVQSTPTHNENFRATRKVLSNSQSNVRRHVLRVGESLPLKAVHVPNGCIWSLFESPLRHGFASCPAATRFSWGCRAEGIFVEVYLNQCSELSIFSVLLSVLRAEMGGKKHVL